MKQSHLFSLTSRKDPQGAEAISHKLFVRAGYIDQLASGVFSLLPLGLRSLKKVENIIREEMNAIDAQEITMPSLHPRSLWEETERYETFDPPLFTFQDRHGKDLLIAPTHEETVTDLARKYIQSYKQLPIAAYQIQNKFRNEMRATGGLLRVREFIMKDLYSFHASLEDLKEYYEKVSSAYFNIFNRCGLDTVRVEADSGSIGGSGSNEFMALCSVGEDRVLICESCNKAFNVEVLESDKKCPDCGGSFKEARGIETGHIFQLQDVYSSKLKATFTDKDGIAKPLVMGCYGIGVGRLLAAVAEVHNDDKGLVWPKSITPFHVHLLNLSKKDEVVSQAEALYIELQEAGYDVLYDDRADGPGSKLKDADLLGISVRLVVGDKTDGKIEYKERALDEVRLFDKGELKEVLKEFYS